MPQSTVSSQLLLCYLSEGPYQGTERQQTSSSHQYPPVIKFHHRWVKAENSAVSLRPRDAAAWATVETPRAFKMLLGTKHQMTPEKGESGRKMMRRREEGGQSERRERVAITTSAEHGRKGH
eukprot:758169-Hanusia_phi.AAC.2